MAEILPMQRRSGVTLVEVLVAIFVMGIGMIALLTLFPIGVLRPWPRRSATNTHSQAACIAHENAIIYNLRNDVGTAANPGVVTAWADLYDKGATNADVFTNPYPGGGLPPADPYGESYTVFVDPIGYFNAGSSTPDWVGGAAYVGALRRRPVSFVNGNATNIYRSFTLWDDMAFNNLYDTTTLPITLPGTPELAGTTVMRNSPYSWGYTIRRPISSDRSVVESSIVVFDSRSLSLTANLNLGEYVYPKEAYFNPNNSTVVVGPFTAPNGPPIRAGNWIMDATVYKTAAGAGSQHNYWYRVLATQDVTVGINTYAVFEIQGVIRGFSNFPNAMVADPTNAASTAYQGTVVILDGVAEVFERGPARTP